LQRSYVLGTGKSYVFEHVCNAVRLAGGSVIKMAPTGMAANAIGGRTAHSVLGLPLNMQEDSRSSIDARQKRYHALLRATMLIFDEVAMASYHYFRILHQLLCEVHGLDERTAPLFAGVVVWLGGDFRQLGPVAMAGMTISELHFRNWPLFDRFVYLYLPLLRLHVIKLHTNFTILEGSLHRNSPTSFQFELLSCLTSAIVHSALNSSYTHYWSLKWSACVSVLTQWNSSLTCVRQKSWNLQSG
jgi:hypothetical protein